MRKMRPVILLLAVMALFLFGRWYFEEPEEECLTRAQAARMLAYALYDMEESENGEARALIDVEDGIWYADEIQVIVKNGMMQTDGDLFHPTEFVTYKEAEAIALRLGKAFDVPPLKEKRPVPLKKWMDLYDEIIAGLQSVEEKMLLIEAVPAVSDELKPWEARTSQGIYICEGVTMDSYVGQEVRAYVSGNQLLMAVKKDSETMSEDTGQTDPDQTDSDQTDSDQTDRVKSGSSADSSEKECDIRICLMTTDFTSEYHEKVMLMSDEDWHITFEDGIRQCLPGETVTLTAEDFSVDGEMAEIKADNNGKIQVLSIERGIGFPSYEGTLRVMRSGSQLLLVNILPMEQYLYGVVPGEMPAAYGSEALKAQAVCARSYAVLALQMPKYEFAEVNDSTACQVYMNQGCDERCTAAVDATAGEVLFSDDQIVTAKYFSTSCGSMSDSDDIWLYPEEAEAIAHITARLETQPPSVPELDDETVFRQFIDEPEESTYVEEDEPWFRWQVIVTPEDIGRNIEKSLKQRMQVNPRHFTVLSDNGEINPDDVKTVEILERADSGVVRKICIAGEKQELTVSGEYNIRCLLAPASDRGIMLQDGDERTGLSLLPSGYFYLEAQEDGDDISGYSVHGGGLGHGAGLSQNGARVLAEQGCSYQEILAYYFENISVGKAPQDEQSAGQ